MSKKNRNYRAGWGDYVTSTVSVTLVLFVLGLVGLINISIDGISKQIREQTGFTVVFTDSIAPASIDSLRMMCNNAPYVSTYKYLSADDVLAEESDGEGDKLVELLGVNPYTPMLEVYLKVEYANTDSVKKIKSFWTDRRDVDYVSINTEMIGNLDRNAKTVNIVLTIVAAILLLITFVLINNTVRLSVYSSRFLIHTMKLVGAKGSFIRRPFLLTGACEGLIAGVFASVMLSGFVCWCMMFDAKVGAIMPWSVIGVVFAALLALGVIICVLAAFLATNRYLQKSYDEMFD